MNQDEFKASNNEDVRYSDQNRSQLHLLPQMQAALALRNQQNGLAFQAMASSDLGHSAATSTRLAPMMEFAVMQQRLALEEEARQRMMEQVAMIGRSSSLTRRFSNLDTANFPLANSDYSLNLSTSTNERWRMSLEDTGLRSLPVMYGGQHAHVSKIKGKAQNGHFPLPKLKKQGPVKVSVSIPAFKKKWDSISRTFRSMGLPGSSETTAVKECLGRAIQFNKIDIPHRKPKSLKTRN